MIREAHPSLNQAPLPTPNEKQITLPCCVYDAAKLLSPASLGMKLPKPFPYALSLDPHGRKSRQHPHPAPLSPQSAPRLIHHDVALLVRAPSHAGSCGEQLFPRSAREERVTRERGDHVRLGRRRCAPISSRARCRADGIRTPATRK
eukprot:5870669-Pleurochrysis_carterae.AAC.1